MINSHLVFSSDCSNGDVRLMGGANSLEGRVEICLDNNYSTVCDDLWDEEDAKVVCRQLDYNGPGIHCNATWPMHTYI